MAIDKNSAAYKRQLAALKARQVAAALKARQAAAAKAKAKEAKAAALKAAALKARQAAAKRNLLAKMKRIVSLARSKKVYLLSSSYSSLTQNLKWRCSNGKTFNMSLNNIANNMWYTKCGRISNTVPVVVPPVVPPVVERFVPNAILWPNNIVEGTKDQFKAMFEMYLGWGVNTLPIHPWMVKNSYSTGATDSKLVYLERMLAALDELGNPPLCLEFSYGEGQDWKPNDGPGPTYTPIAPFKNRGIDADDYEYDPTRWHTFITDPLEIRAHHNYPYVYVCPWYRGDRFQTSIDRFRELMNWFKPSAVWFNPEYITSPSMADYYAHAIFDKHLSDCTRCQSQAGHLAGLKATGDEFVAIAHSIVPNCTVLAYASIKRTTTEDTIYVPGYSTPLNSTKDQTYVDYASFNINCPSLYGLGTQSGAPVSAVDSLNSWLLPESQYNWVVKCLGAGDYPTLTQGHKVVGNHPINFYTNQEWYDLCYRIAQLGCPGFALWPSWVGDVYELPETIAYSAAARRLIPIGIQAFKDYKNNTTRSYPPQAFAPNYFHHDDISAPVGVYDEFIGEFWPGSGVGRDVHSGSVGEDRFQVLWGHYVFASDSVSEGAYTWNGVEHTNPGLRTLPLDEAIDRPWLEYWIDRFCVDGDWVLLDEEYIEPWYGTTNQNRIDRWQAVMTLVDWAQAYSRGEGIDQSKGNRNMKFGFWNVGPLRAMVWDGYTWGIGNDPGPGWSGWMSDWQDTGIENADYNLHKAAALVDFYAPYLYIYDNSIEYWNMQLESVLYCLYDSNDQWTLPKKPVIPALAPQVWGPGSTGVPVDLDVLNKMIDDVYTTKRNGQLVFEKAYWYIASSVYSWGDPQTNTEYDPKTNSYPGDGWWQQNPGTLPPQIELIKNKTLETIDRNGIGNKKYMFIIPPLIGSVEGMASSYATLETAAALGYNGVVMSPTTGTQYATEIIWEGANANVVNWPTNAAAFRQKCTDLGLEFILGTFMPVIPNEGGYAYGDPGANAIYLEGLPVKNQRFKVSGSTLVIDDSVVRFKLPTMNWDGLPEQYWSGEWAWWGDWNLGTKYSYPYSQLIHGEWNGIDGQHTHSSWQTPIFAERVPEVAPGSTADKSLKWTIPDEFTWSSQTSYTTGKIIIKNDRVFYAYIGGTSGVSEPNWSDPSLSVNTDSSPLLINNPSHPDKIVDGGVTWALQERPWIGLQSYILIYPSSNISKCKDTEMVQNSYIDLAFDIKYQNSNATKISVGMYGYYSDTLVGPSWELGNSVNLDSDIYNSGHGYGGSRVATTVPGGTGYDMDWTRIHVPFNTVDCTNAAISIRFLDEDGNDAVNPGSKVWVSNITTKSAGLLNILRRGNNATPISMRSLDGNIAYYEGIDFTGAVDGTIASGQGGGLWHGLNGGYLGDQSVPNMTILPGSPLSALAEGTVVLMDYYHIGFFNNEVKPCFAEPALYDFYESYIPKVIEQWHPDGWFIETSEVRMLGWDKACTDIGTVGQVLANHINQLTALVKAADPGKPIYVWSDMWDETHNGTNRKYLVASSPLGSWGGLHSDTIIMNWFKEIPSLKFFNDKGFNQVVSSYYDVANFATVEADLFDYAAALGPDRIKGAMYTTWKNDYSKLEEYMTMLTGYSPISPT